MDISLDWGFIFLVLNYAALAGTFIYAYLNPKEWNEWLVTSSSAFFFIYVLTVFLVFYGAFFFSPYIMAEAMECLPLTVGIPLIMLFAILFMMKKQFELLGSHGLLPLILYLGSIGQQMLHFLMSPENTYLAFGILAFIYFLGSIVMAIGGTALGFAIRLLTPGLYAEHIAQMQKNFGPGAPDFIRFKNNTSMSGSLSKPSELLGVGLVYCLWMVLSAIIFA